MEVSPSVIFDVHVFTWGIYILKEVISPTLTHPSPTLHVGRGGTSAAVSSPQ
jgi:hypothetical protein